MEANCELDAIAWWLKGLVEKRTTLQLQYEWHILDLKGVGGRGGRRRSNTLHNQTGMKHLTALVVSVAKRRREPGNTPARPNTSTSHRAKKYTSRCRLPTPHESQPGPPFSRPLDMQRKKGVCSQQHCTAEWRNSLGWVGYRRQLLTHQTEYTASEVRLCTGERGKKNCAVTALECQ